MELSDELPSNPNPNPNPSLRPTSTAFKREARKQHRQQKRQRKLEQHLQDMLETLELQPPKPSSPVPHSDIEWPCNPTPAQLPDTAGWGVSAWDSTPPIPITTEERASTEELEKKSAVQTQQNVVAACREFLLHNEDDDDDDDGEEEDGFFMGMFERDGELRGLYEREWEKGEFCCLVCGGIGEKAGKRYVGTAGLVQHCELIVKTKRRAAHRAFGRAVSRVLGWEASKPSSTGGERGGSFSNPCALAENEFSLGWGTTNCMTCGMANKCDFANSSPLQEDTQVEEGSGIGSDGSVDPDSMDLMDLQT